MATNDSTQDWEPWPPHLECRGTSPILAGGQDGQPELEILKPGLRINATRLTWDGSTAEFRLLMSFALPGFLHAAFQYPEWAIQVAVECPETGQCCTFDLKDPFSEYAELAEPNFRGDPEPSDQETGMQGGGLGLDREVRFPPGLERPHLCITAYLQELVSNTLTLDLDRLEVTSHLEGESHAP